MTGIFLGFVFVMSVLASIAKPRLRKPGRMTIHLGKGMYREILPDHQ